MKGIEGRSWPVVTADGTGIVSHAGTALLRELAERVRLRVEYSVATDGLRSPGGGHDPGPVLVDLAVMLAAGGQAIADITTLAEQPVRHRPVASAATAWRVRAGIDEQRLGRLRQARAVSREWAWLGRADERGGCCRRHVPRRDLDYAVIDLDATLIEVHSEKDQASPHLSGGAVLDHLIAQPDGRSLQYSVGYAVTEDVRKAIRLLPERAWNNTIDARRGFTRWRTGRRDHRGLSN